MPNAAVGAAPDASQLAALLAAELDRLGVDPAKTPAAAPQGEGNSPFDLELTVVDPDGTGAGLPTSVEVYWTGGITGDYNQDGLVGVSDLTPLGQNYLETVSYHELAPHGVQCWPLGQPLDDGGNDPPVAGSGADMWRRAQVDGNSDGLINVSDITPIGQHWNERLDGYRIYRIRPGDAGFDWLPNPDNATLPYTIAYEAAFPMGSASPDPNRPVSFAFSDTQLGAALGWFEYYVVAYDEDSGTEGPPSPFVGVDLNNGGGGSMPPQVVLTADVDHGEFPLTVNFKAGGSWDPDGTIAKYEWDMDGNLSGWEYDSTPATTLQMTYNSVGTKHQWVRVTDNDGLTATALAKVSVSAAGGNRPPVAELMPDPGAGELPLDVTWDAGGSFDLDGSIVKYEWDMDGDQSTWEWDSGTTATLDMTYNSTGVHTQYVRVTDDGGLTDTAFGQVEVFAPAGNQPPTAVISPSVSEGAAPLTVTFDASASSDPDGNVQQYEWDFDGDGSIDSTTGMPTIFTTYLDPGDYQPTVTVTDDVGVTDTAATNVLVHGWLKKLVDAGPSLGYDVSAAVVNGRPAIAYSMDDWVNSMQVRYIRAADSHGEHWSGGQVIVHDGGTTNHVGTSLSLAVVNGRPAIAYEDNTDTRLYYKRADDQDGSSWPVSPVQADISSSAAGAHCSLAVIDGWPAIAQYYVSFGDLFYVRALDVDGTSWAAPMLVHDGVQAGLYPALINYSGTATIPLIAHFDAAGGTVYLETATTAAGSTWNAPAAICGVGDADVSTPGLALVDGLPAAVYFGLDQFGVPGLNYRRATNSSFNWGAIQQLVTGGYNGLDPCLQAIGGYPAVAYRYSQIGSQFDLNYIAATDATGGSWGSVETVENSDHVGTYVSLIEVDGRPGIAYTLQGSGELWYAYRY